MDTSEHSPVLTFRDENPGDMHQKFEDWKANNSGAYVLNYLNETTAMLHHLPCPHLEGPHQEPAEGKSRTARTKECCPDLNVLVTHAAARSIRIKQCATCMKPMS